MHGTAVHRFGRLVLEVDCPRGAMGVLSPYRPHWSSNLSPAQTPRAHVQMLDIQRFKTPSQLGARATALRGSGTREREGRLLVATADAHAHVVNNRKLEAAVIYECAVMETTLQDNEKGFKSRPADPTPGQG